MITIKQIEEEFDKEFPAEYFKREVGYFSQRYGYSQAREVKSFYRHKIEELVRGLVPIEAKAKDDDQMARLGWNTCREMMLGRIKQAGIELTEE